MRPRLVDFLPIHSYGFMLLMAFYAAWMLAHWRAKREGINPGYIADLLVWCVLGGIFGARLAYILTHRDEFTGILDLLKVWEGGLVFYGGLALGTVAALCVLYWRKLPPGKVADVMAPSLALGLAFGRIGCFLCGCCWGDVCPEDSFMRPVAVTFPGKFVRKADAIVPEGSMTFAQHVERGLITAPKRLPNGANELEVRSLPVFPSQLISSLAAALLCIVLNLLYRFKKLDGEIFLFFGILYSVNRFLIEFIRDDNPKVQIWSFNTYMTISQILSIFFLVTCAALLVRGRLAARRPGPGGQEQAA